MLDVIFTEKFISQVENLTPKIQKLVEKKIEVFKNNPRHSSLKTHKLNGVLDGYFSFSINYKTRIVFEYNNKNTVIFLKIGDHEVYR